MFNRITDRVVVHIMAMLLVLMSASIQAADAKDVEDIESIGRVIDNVLKHDLVFLEDEALLRSLNAVLSALNTKNDSLSTDYQVYLINSTLPNAFASPTGSIYVTTGILDKLTNKAELAFILAHQIAHVEGTDGFDEFARVRSRRSKIMWATYIMLGVITIATVGAMASAAAALNA